MRELAAVFVNEWMKLVRRRRFLVTTVLSLFVVALFGLVAYHRYHDDLRYNPTSQLQSQEAELKQQIAELQQQPSSKDRDMQLTQQKQKLAAVEDQLNQNQQAQGDGWKTELQRQISVDEATIRQLQSSTKPEDVVQVEGARANLMQDRYALDHNVKPLTWPTVNVFQQVIQFMNVGARIFLPLLVIVLVADMVSGEATDGTIKLLLIRSVSRVNIWVGKWLVSLVASAGWTLLLCVALLLIGFSIMGVRGAAQPILTNVYYTAVTMPPMEGVGSPGTLTIPHYEHAQVLPAWQFVGFGFLYTALAMMVVATIAMLCSTLFRSAMVSTAAAMGSIVVGFIVMQMAQHERWVAWLFPTHLNLMDNWNGDLSNALWQPVGLATGLLVLGVWAVLALAVAILQFRHRDVLNT
ncbi:ABC transporter permease [Alicyclobacillus contaminans]|uniref:ABC transporter permease subunit n=1 Tax=Alicyclobacillus contaminans TaxID=392016 RepID=UPI0003F646AC|nr:ABC transporter permease subunit [Alicyclobacillus contaminans]GMA51987.1 ABC transporter permease [Alicyclobacillus contaminans]